MRSSELDVLSSCLLNREHIFKMLQYDRGIFQSPDLQQCRDAIAGLYADGLVVDLPAFHAKVKADYKKVDIDNIVSDLMRRGSCLNIDYVLDKMAENLKRLRLHDEAVDLVNALEKNDLNYDEIIDRLIEERSADTAKKHTDLLTYLNDNDLDEIFKSISYVPTGVGPLDEKIDGFYGGQFVLIAARPGVGKTSLALEIAESGNKSVLFFSLEMVKQEIYAKILARHTSIDSRRIMRNILNDVERLRLIKKHDELKKSIRLILFDTEMNLKTLVYYINHFVRHKKPDMVVVDYIQLIYGAPGENENVRISTISRTLKLLAMKHKIPVVALSQLSRSSARENRAPQLQDLRGSGSLEQDANIVIFLHENEEGRTEIVVAKNRMGRVGKVLGLDFEKSYSRFADVGVG